MFGNLFNQKKFGPDGTDVSQQSSDGVMPDPSAQPVNAADLSATTASVSTPINPASGQPFDPSMNVNEIAAQMRAQQPQQPVQPSVSDPAQMAQPAPVAMDPTAIPPVQEGVPTTVETTVGVSGLGDITMTTPASVTPIIDNTQQVFPAAQTMVTQPGAAVPPPPPANPPVDSSSADSSLLNPQNRGSMSAMSRLDPRATQVINHAKEETKRIKQAMIEPDQLLFGLIYDGEIFKLLEQFSLDAAKISRDIQEKAQVGTFVAEPTLSEATRQVLEQAYTGTKNRGASFITPEDILIALFSQSSTGDLLQNQGLQKTALEQKLAKTSGFATAKVSVLEKFGVDLTESARNGELDPVTGRDKETERLIHILLRRTKNNPIIIGEPGVGKTAIVESLALQIVAGQIPQDLKDRKIIQLDIAALIAGASHRGEFEERLRGVIKEVQAAAGQIILFIDEIHTLVGAGDTEGALDASNIIKPFLARGQLQVIGTTTSSEYRKYFQKDKAFERRFQAIVAEEPTEEVAIQMIDVVKGKYEKYHNIVFLPEAIEGAVHLSKKYIGERYLPDKAVDLIDEAAAEVKLQVNSGSRQDNQIKKSDIEKVVSAWTNIPITRLTEDESEKLLHLEDLIHKRLIDQKEAVSAVAEAVRRGRIGLASANRPIASFIFLGPTGVGKTELAKTLAEIMFGRDDATIRLDMSEYMEKHEVAKLIGAPPGYVGYEEGGQLTEAVRAKPYSIVLLDEVEKAHPDVFNLLLQILEDGRLTDNKGNTISFKNTIIIATSNLGSSMIQKHILGELMEGEEGGDEKEAEEASSGPKGEENKDSTSEQTAKSQGDQSDSAKETSAAPQKEKTEDGQQQNPSKQTQGDGQNQSTEQKPKQPKEINFEELNKILLEELHKFFRPELLNRFDELVVFKPLSQGDMSSIAQLGIAKTSKLLKEQGLSVQITENALGVLAREGYDPIYGARPLRRLIQSAIENPIAIEIISKKYLPNDIILIDFDDANGKFVFSKAAPQPGAAPVPQPGQPQMAYDPNQQMTQPPNPNAPIGYGGQIPPAPQGQNYQQQPQPGMPPVQSAPPQSTGYPQYPSAPIAQQPPQPTDQNGMANPSAQPPTPDTSGNGAAMANGTYSSTAN